MATTRRGSRPPYGALDAIASWSAAASLGTVASIGGTHDPVAALVALRRLLDRASLSILAMGMTPPPRWPPCRVSWFETGHSHLDGEAGGVILWVRLEEVKMWDASMVI